MLDGKRVLACEKLYIGMFSISSDGGSNSKTIVELKSTALANVKIYLNKSPFITNTNYCSTIGVYLDDVLIGYKKSNKASSSANEEEGDFNLFYDEDIEPNNKIRFEIESVKDANGTVMTNYLSTASDVLFGMIVPMTKPSQVKEMELGKIRISLDENSDRYVIGGNVFFGIKGDTVDLSVFYSNEEIDDPTNFDEVASIADCIQTDCALEHEFSNTYSIETDLISDTTGIYVFGKNPRTNEIFYSNNNGMSYAGD